jgi:diguanylate cyclase (GGDEF)-like protein
MRLTRDHASPAFEIPLNRPVSAASAWLVVTGTLALIFVVDRGTGLAPFQHLYYLPIIFASVRFGYGGSATAGAAAVFLYHLANPHVLTLRYEESDLVQMALFVAVGVASAKLANDSRRLHRLALTDDLTGLHNLRSFEARLRMLVRASRQRSAPLALLVLDLDRLKSLNDTHGHLAGAEAVRTVGHLIATRVPQDAVACRYGGDEFVIALPQCDEAQARVIADDLRHAVNTCVPVLAGASFPAGTLSISVGIACRLFEPRAPSKDRAVDEAEGEELFRAADAALYAAKSSGRNRVSGVPASPRAASARSTSSSKH